jgi:hypothetical protein
MKKMEKNYVTPAVEVYYCLTEGVLCASNERLEETEGIW